MTPAFVDGADPSLFRGRTLPYWIEHSFPFCNFAACQKGPAQEMVLVFSGRLFPALGAVGRRELRSWLRSAGSLGKDLFAAPGKPFFAVRRAFLKRQGIALEPGVHSRLRRLAAADLPIAHPPAPLDPALEPLAVEMAVIQIQLAHLDRLGVQVDDRSRFYAEGLPRIGRGSRLGPGTVLRGECRIGRDVSMQAHCCIENSVIGDGCRLLPGVILVDSRVERDVQLGPYCHVRLNSLVRRGAKVGNFVEMKKSAFGRGSKAMHLSYIGDATVGRRVNIGAGTITCNYDGQKKNPTVIGDGVFIGSGTELVAPVVVSRDSYVAAGSTITENVPRHSLAVARGRQRNIRGWVLRKRSK